MTFAPHFLWSLGLTLVLPMIGGRAVPARVKLMFAVCIGLFLSALSSNSLIGTVTLSNLNIPQLVVHFIVGAAVGLLFRLIFSVFEIFGSIVSNAMSMMQLTAGQDGGQTSVYSDVSAIFAGFIFLTAGGHLWMLRAIAAQYPTLHRSLNQDGIESAFFLQISSKVPDIFSSVFLTAFALTMPFLAFTVIYYLTLGLVNRLFPQFMVIIVGAPLLILGGMILLLLILPFVFDVSAVLWRVIDGVSRV